MGKASCIDLGSTFSVRSLISALLTALTSAECTLSATGGREGEEWKSGGRGGGMVG